MFPCPQTTGCPICSAITRATAKSPPLLHEAAALPALIGGSWLSSSCESFQGGLWLRRKFQIYPGDKLWRGQWDYYADSRCSFMLYVVNGAGSYVQRNSRQRRHSDHQKLGPAHPRERRRADSEDFRDFLPDVEPSVIESFSAMLRGNPRKEESAEKNASSPPPSGTTELDLHVAESLLIPVEFAVAVKCGSDVSRTMRCGH